MNENIYSVQRNIVNTATKVTLYSTSIQFNFILQRTDKPL